MSTHPSKNNRVKQDVESMVGLLCIERGFRKHTANSWIKPTKEGLSLIEAYRHMSGQRIGIHYLDVKFCYFSYLKDNSVVLKPYQFPIFRRMNQCTDARKGEFINDLLNDESDMGDTQRFSALSDLFSESIDSLLELMGSKKTLVSALKDDSFRRQVVVLGPALDLVGEHYLGDWPPT